MGWHRPLFLLDRPAGQPPAPCQHCPGGRHLLPGTRTLTAGLSSARWAEGLEPGGLDSGCDSGTGGCVTLGNLPSISRPGHLGLMLRAGLQELLGKEPSVVDGGLG